MSRDYVSKLCAQALDFVSDKLTFRPRSFRKYRLFADLMEISILYCGLAFFCLFNLTEQILLFRLVNYEWWLWQYPLATVNVNIHVWISNNAHEAVLSILSGFNPSVSHSWDISSFPRHNLLLISMVTQILDLFKYLSIDWVSGLGAGHGLRWPRLWYGPWCGSVDLVLNPNSDAVVPWTRTDQVGCWLDRNIWSFNMQIVHSLHSELPIEQMS